LAQSAASSHGIQLLSPPSSSLGNTSHSRYQQASTTAATGDTVGDAQQSVVCGGRRAADDNTTRIHSMSKQQKQKGLLLKAGTFKLPTAHSHHLQGILQKTFQTWRIMGTFSVTSIIDVGAIYSTFVQLR
jgi:hypothetical protein